MKFAIQITPLLSQPVIEKTNNKLIFPLTSNPPTNLSCFGGNAAVLTNNKKYAFTFRTVEMEVFGTS